MAVDEVMKAMLATAESDADRERRPSRLGAAASGEHGHAEAGGRGDQVAARRPSIGGPSHSAPTSEPRLRTENSSVKAPSLPPRVRGDEQRDRRPGS